MSAVICTYCGVAHAQAQTHCSGCGGNLPAPQERDDPRPRRRNVAAAVVGAAVLLTVVLVVANRLSGPQKVEIVATRSGPAGASVEPPQFEAGSLEQRYLTNANLAGAIAAVSPLRMLLMEYRQMEGRYPASFSDLGVAESDLADGRFVAAVTLTEGGALLATLEAGVFGEGALLELRPVDVMAGMQTRWDCRTTVPDDARVDMPGSFQCPYDDALSR